MDNVKIGHRIKQRRLELNLTLQEVAEKVNVNKSTIQRYEAGNIKDVKLPIIESIAKALNTDPLWIIGKIDSIKKHSEKYEHVTYLADLYFKSVMEWSEDKLLDEDDTIIIREHVSDLLSRYKRMLEMFVNSKLYWNRCKDSYSELYKNRENPLSDKEIKEIFLKQELENEITNITNWINAFPNWVARQEELIKDKSSLNVTDLITTTKEQEYNLAAHNDTLDGETAKTTLEKAKAIFKQMDEEE